MTLIWRILMPVLLGLGIIFLTVQVYLKVYKVKINRRLEEGIVGEEKTGKAMMPPIMVFILTLIGVTAAVYVVILILVGLFSFTDRNKSETSHYIHYYTLNEEERKDTLFEGCTVGEPIKGYSMHTACDGDIKFTYYVSDKLYSGLTPQVLLNAQYTGEKTISDTAESASYDNTTFGSHGAPADSNSLTAISIDGFAGVFTYEFAAFEDPTAAGADAEEVIENAAIKGRLVLNWAELEMISAGQ